MSAVFGRNITLSIFGESHGVAIGCVLGGLPAGIKLDMEYIHTQMQRRVPGKSELATARCEADLPEIVSGVLDGYTTGAPLTMLIKNNTQRSRDYSQLATMVRPGHADYGARVKYQGFNDYRGGGHFSGRITAPLVFAGAIARLILQEKNIVLGACINSIGSISTQNRLLDGIARQELVDLGKESFPCLEVGAAEEMKRLIVRAKTQGDSVGGRIECAVQGIPAGIGENFFDSLESQLASMLFSIPAVKGVEFGAGFDIASMYGSQSNDSPCYNNGVVEFGSNNNGGIVGGITNGSPVVLRVAIKPTPSIYKEQQTIDMENRTNTHLSIEGRHDPCIVPRAVPVVEAAVAWVVLDNLL